MLMSRRALGKQGKPSSLRILGETRSCGGARLICHARLLRDAELFDSRLSKIEGAGDIGMYVKNVVEGKSVQTTPAPAPAAAAAQTPAAEEKAAESEGKK